MARYVSGTDILKPTLLQDRPSMNMARTKSLPVRIVVQQSDTKKSKDHICKECGNEYRYISCLYRHIRLAHNMKQYPLTRRQNVSMRRGIHICQDCGARYAFSTGLIRHKRITHGNHRYKCDTCGKCYKRKSSLKQHLVTRHGSGKVILLTAMLMYMHR